MSRTPLHSITIPLTRTTYTANFLTQYYLTTRVSPVTGGIILPVSGWVYGGAVVSVGETSNKGYVFSGFSGALTGTTTPMSLTLTSPAAVTANFSASVVTVSLTPGATLRDSQTKQFTASVTGTTNTSVTWALSPTVGKISTSGLYTAPSSIPYTQSVNVIATSVADSTKHGTSVITLMPVVALQWAASTSSGFSGGYNIYRSGVSGGPYSKINSVLVTATSFTDSTVQGSNQYYYYVVTAVDSSGVESAYSREAQALVQ
jgi:fibronectin type 3 domain-containing protein